MPSDDTSDTTRVITADDIVEPRDYNPDKQGSPNDTDYELPTGWGLMTDQQRADWYDRDRARRQAIRQDTPLGRRAQAELEAQQRLDTNQFRVDDDIE